MSEPKEIGVLFAAPMVLALWEGRKTNTRRIAKPSVVECIDYFGGGADGEPATKDSFQTGYRDDGSLGIWSTEYPEEGSETITCPYGKPGDRLWVREAHQIWSRPMSHDSIVCYRADNSTRVVKSGGCVRIPNGTMTLGSPLSEFEREDGRWRPSIHMPRAACRLVLEVTETRVERLHDISDEDAIAEGIEQLPEGFWRWKNYSDESKYVPSLGSPLDSFLSLWQSINGAESWKANPWVWVVKFKEFWRAELDPVIPEPEPEAPKAQIIDLFEALKQSLAEAKSK